jgi:hypothetical protein
MQRIAICSEAMRTKDSGVYRVLLTVLTSRDPQYVLLNLIDVPSEELFEQGDMIEITLKRVNRKGC